jgi:hypothetical protein
MFDGNYGSTTIGCAQGSAIHANGATVSLISGCTFVNHDLSDATMIAAISPLTWHCQLGQWAPLSGTIPRRGASPDFFGCPYRCPLGSFGDRTDFTTAEECPRHDHPPNLGPSA